MKLTPTLFLIIAYLAKQTNANETISNIPPYVICDQSQDATNNNNLKRCRMFPTLYLIGCGRCGSTSLYSMLVRHPDIRSGTVLPGEQPWISKELEYWDNNAKFPDQEWYLDHFPVNIITNHSSSSPSSSLLVSSSESSSSPPSPLSHLRTMDASPSYAAIAKTPERIIENTYPRDILPHMRFIEVLRDPVDRFVSYFCQILEEKDWASWLPHLTNINNNSKNNGRALRLQRKEELLVPLVSQAMVVIERCLSEHPDPFRNEEQMLFHWCVRKQNPIFKLLVDGLYLRQMWVWTTHFPLEQFMLLATEDLKPGVGGDRLVEVMNSIVDFTGIREEEETLWKDDVLKSYDTVKNEGKGRRCSKNTVPVAALERLYEFYRPHNLDLIEWLSENKGKIGSIDNVTIAHMKSWVEESRISRQVR